MYLNILKKDLRRKKTMNVIVLLFVILSAMFAASSVNNIIAVATGIDHYFEKAGMSDYFIITLDSSNEGLDELLGNETSVTDYKRERSIFADKTNFARNGELLADYDRAAFIMPIDNAQLNFFDKNNNIIKEVEPGKAYISGIMPRISGIFEGDSFTV